MPKQTMKPLASVDDYVTAFEALADRGLSDGVRAMLRAHYSMPDRVATMRDLAQAAGYAGAHQGANGAYGGFGGRVRDELRLEYRSMALFSIATWEDVDQDDEFAFRMRPEVAGALERLGWTGGDGKSGSANDAPLDPAAITLDQIELAGMRDTFLERMEDFGDFTERSGTYWHDERLYKDELSTVARSLLVPSLFEELSTARSAAVVAAAKQVLTAKLPSTKQPQNLASWRYTAFLGKLTPAENMTFARALQALLYGVDPSPVRAAVFTHAMWPTFRRIGPGNPYALGRIIPTLFLMLLDPAHDIAFRTDLFDSASRRLLGQSILRNAPLGEGEYQDVLAFSLEVKRALEAWAWCPRDMIDVHSFLWVTTTSAYAGSGNGTSTGET